MNRKILAAGLAAVAVMAALPATAQDKPMGLSIRAGVFFPTSSLLRDNSRSLFIGGAEYKIKDLNLETGTAGMRTSLTISADYIGNADFRNIPVLLNVVARTSNSMYWTAGAGIGFTGGLLDTGTTFAYQLGVGYDFQAGGKNPLFIEGHYFGAAKSDANGFAIMVGIRL